MSESTSSGASTGGVGFFGLMGLLFIGLKLGHVIDWSWWWVTAPLWAPAGTVLAILVAAAVMFAFCAGALWVGRRLARLAKRYQSS